MFVKACSSFVLTATHSRITTIPAYNSSHKLNATRFPTQPSRRGLLDKALLALEEEQRTNVVVLQVDVTDEASIQTAVKAIIEKENRLDCLVNNAGCCLAGFSETVELSQVQSLFEVNYFGVIRMLQAVLPQMRKQKKGHILSISSQSAIVTTTGLGFYAASKKSLEALHEGEAPLLWYEWGIKMTLLECGNIITSTEHMVDRLDNCKRVSSQTPSVYSTFIESQKEIYKRQLPQHGLHVSLFSQKIHELLSATDWEKLPPRVQLGTEEDAKKNWQDPTGEVAFCKGLQMIEFLTQK